MLKPKRCKTCGEEFQPRSGLQRVCGPKCAIQFVQAKGVEREARRVRREKAEGRKRLRTKRDYLRDAQVAFNKFIRLRDEGKPCVSCGITNPIERNGGAWDAGHYRTRAAAPELRFDELNCHRQCKSCNTGEKHHSGKAETVRKACREELIRRIGLSAVESLEGPHEPKKYTIEDLIAIRDLYRAKAKRLREGRE